MSSANEQELTVTDDSTKAGTTSQLKAQIKGKIANLVAQVEEHASNPREAKTLITKVLQEYADAGFDWEPKAIDFDFDEELPPPDWLVDRAIERGTVVVLSGDTGAAKSIVCSSLLASALTGEEWLGLRTSIERLTVIDEENPERLVSRRLGALGVQNEARNRFRYFNREGIAIGDGGRSDAWLRRHLEEFRPDLLIVDTLMAACEVADTNSNSDAVRMMKFLRSLAVEFDCSILVLHHERKPSKDNPASAGLAMMGARQWAGQSDQHMTLTVESDLLPEETDSNGTVGLRRTFKFRGAQKDRDGQFNAAQRVCVSSEKDSEGRLLWMKVENEGEIEGATTETDALAASLGSLIQRSGIDMSVTDIAKGVSKEAQDSTFKRALVVAQERDYVDKVKRGVYRGGEVSALDI